MTEPEKVVDFWLGAAAKSASFAAQQKKLWYRSSKAVDDEIRLKFSEQHNRAINGDLEHWRDSADSTLALVILLDQFSRHLYRGTAAAFAYDSLAIDIASSCPLPESLPLIGRAFLYHPFKHSESLKIQEQSVQQFADLAAEADDEWRPMMENFNQHALEHYSIVKAFGRFPHRNLILGRVNTEAESNYFAKGGKSFGQRIRSKHQI